MASVGTWLNYESKNQFNSEVYAENCGELNIWFFPWILLWSSWIQVSFFFKLIAPTVLWQNQGEYLGVMGNRVDRPQISMFFNFSIVLNSENKPRKCNINCGHTSNGFLCICSASHRQHGRVLAAASCRNLLATPAPVRAGQRGTSTPRQKKCTCWRAFFP